MKWSVLYVVAVSAIVVTSGAELTKVMRGIETEVKPSQRIVNGFQVPDGKPRKYPWQVGLKYPGTDTEEPYFCGGSIISDKYILTAAHCFYEFNIDTRICKKKEKLNTIVVGIGSNTQTKTYTIKVENIIEYDNPNYNCNQGNINDIAVIETATSMEPAFENGFAQKVYLAYDDTQTYDGMKGIISGWGSIVGYNAPIPPAQPPAPSYPDDLMGALVPILDFTKCRDYYPSLLTENMICTSTQGGFNAKPPNQGKGPCHGDSGGPLIIKQDDKHLQIGIVSLGKGCASEGNPAIYTRVTKYIKWIVSKVIKN